MQIWCSHTYLFDFQAPHPYCPTVPLTSTPLILKVEKKYGMITYFVWRTYSVWRWDASWNSFPSCFPHFLFQFKKTQPQSTGMLWNLHRNPCPPGSGSTPPELHGFKVQGSIPRGGAYPHPPKKTKKTREKIKIPRARPWFFVCFAATVGFWKELRNCSEAQKASLPTPQCHAKRPPSG